MNRPARIVRAISADDAVPARQPAPVKRQAIAQADSVEPTDTARPAHSAAAASNLTPGNLTPGNPAPSNLAPIDAAPASVPLAADAPVVQPQHAAATAGEADNETDEAAAAANEPDAPTIETAAAAGATSAPDFPEESTAHVAVPRFAKPDKALIIRELKELTKAREMASGTLRKTGTPPAATETTTETEGADAQSTADPAALLSELAELARNGGRRNAERVQEEITLHMERFRDKYADLPI